MNPAAEQAIADLFRRSVARPFSIEEWRWKMRDAVSPVETVFVAGHGDSRCAAHYGGSPRRVVVDGKERWAMAGSDAMTAPEHRRQGLLTRVATQARQTWTEGGVAFEIGVPSAAYGSRAEALGWEAALELEGLLYPIAPAAILARRLRFTSGAVTMMDRLWQRARTTTASRVARHAELLMTAESELDELWSEARPAEGIAVIRDRAWVEWRFLGAPKARGYRVLACREQGRLLGWIAFRSSDDGAGEKAGYYSDLLVKPGDSRTRAALIEAMLQDLTADGATKVHALVPARTRLARAFRLRGFLISCGKLVAQIRRFDPSLALTRFTDAERFSLSPADLDFG